MKKNIRSNVVKESLLDYSTLANSLKENTRSAVRSMLDEAVRDTYAKLLSEDDDKDYEEGEVEDTDSDTAPIEANAEADGGEEPQEGEGDGMEQTEDKPEETNAEEGGDDVIDKPTETDAEGAEGEGLGDGESDDEWADFDKKYKVSDNEYDFSNAEDEDIVKVYKLMQNDDQVFVHKDEDNKVKVQDNETGAEYIIDFGGNADGADGFGAEADLEENCDDMNESTEKLFELVLEYNSNVGYTDNYQKQDVMSNPGMSEPGKNVNDWDAGVPHGTEKPWSGYPSKKRKADKPFDGEKGKQVEESTDAEADMGADVPMEECGDVENQVNELKTNAEHSANVGSTSRTDGPNNPRRRKGRNFHTAQKGQESGTGDNAYNGDSANESFLRKVNKALDENKALKSTLSNVMKSLKEAAVVNKNLAQIIKIVSENSTTRDEKKEIIDRFMNEAKTVQQSEALYESISKELKKAHKMDINESSNSNLTMEGSKKINETTIYKSQDLLDSLDLMHRLMK